MLEERRLSQRGAMEPPELDMPKLCQEATAMGQYTDKYKWVKLIEELSNKKLELMGQTVI